MRRRDLLVGVAAGLVAGACGSSPKTAASSALAASAADSAIPQAFAQRQEQLYSARGLAHKTKDIRFKAPGNANVRVHAKETGSGDPIVLLHGGNGAGALWLPLMTRLPAARLIAPDLPGCGLSDPFLYDGVDMRAFGSAFVKGVLDGMGVKRATLVGNWLGGYWAMCFAIDYPERVDRLILAGGPAGGTEIPAMSAEDIEARIAEIRQPGRAGFARLMANTQRMPEDLLALMDLARQLPGVEESWRSVWRLTATNKLTFALRPEMPKIIAPTLLLWGDQDRVDPPGGGAARAMLAAIGGSRASVIPDAGHLVWIDKPDECARQIVQFLG